MPKTKEAAILARCIMYGCVYATKDADANCTRCGARRPALEEPTMGTIAGAP